MLKCVCGYVTRDGAAPMIFKSKKQMKNRIKRNMVICPKCEQYKSFTVVWEQVNGKDVNYY